MLTIAPQVLLAGGSSPSSSRRSLAADSNGRRQDIHRRANYQLWLPARSRLTRLAVHPVVSQAVQSDVRKISEAVVFGADRNLRDELSSRRVEHVHRCVVAARRPQAGTVGIQ